jgi:wyosine [tRNA(Phe)-imidazoG37] synthetase (radical SAM superfamily)
VEQVVAELESRLSSKPDYITLSGSGEPTMYSRIHELIAKIKTLTHIPVAVLTNGSLLWEKQVRRQLHHADLVIPSLDAGDETMFGVVNRPHWRISFGKMLDGLLAFRQEFSGEFWLEVMVVGGHTGTSAEIAKLAGCVDHIRPDRVQLNTVTRPPAEKHAVGVSPKQLTGFSSMFHPPAEVIADFRGIHQEPEFVGGRKEVLAMLQRRPCSVEDIACGLGMHQNEVVKHVEELSAQGMVAISMSGSKRYYKAAR